MLETATYEKQKPGLPKCSRKTTNHLYTYYRL